MKNYVQALYIYRQITFHIALFVSDFNCNFPRVLTQKWRIDFKSEFFHGDRRKSMRSSVCDYSSKEVEEKRKTIEDLTKLEFFLFAFDVKAMT